MANVQTGGYKALKASQLDAEKENRPPLKRTKRTISLTGMLENARNVRHKTNKESAADLLPLKRTHNNDVGDGFFARFSSKRKAETHPLYFKFQDAAKAYREGVAASGADQIEPVYEELVARVNGLDVRGRPLVVPGVPTKAELRTLDAESCAMSKPIGEEIIEVQIVQADGSMTRKQYTLEVIMDAFHKRFEKQCSGLEKLQRELDQIDEDIAAARDDALTDGDGSIKRADDKLQAKLDAIRENTKTFKDQTFAEVKQAEQEDKAAALETNRKIQEFMRALQ